MTGEQRERMLMPVPSMDFVLDRIKRGAGLEREDLRGLAMPNAVLEGVSFRRCDLDGANLQGATLSRAHFKNASLRGALLAAAVLRDANLETADLEGADLRGADLSGANLARANLERAQLQGANMAGARLTQAQLGSADLSGAILVGAQLAHADLTGANLSLAKLAEADLPDADLTRKRHFGQGDVLRNAQLELRAGATVEIESVLEQCTIALGDATDVVIGKSGVLRECQLSGAGKITIHGTFIERATPGIVGATDLLVSSAGSLVGSVVQPAGLTRFAFEPGCVLRMKILTKIPKTERPPARRNGRSRRKR